MIDFGLGWKKNYRFVLTINKLAAQQNFFFPNLL
jgi:hypothetical protein